jgi:hypothetical protein
MNSESNPFEKMEDRIVDILKYVHESQKAESLQHRQNLFNAFAWWTTVLLAFVGAITALDDPLNDTAKVIIGIAISILSVFVIAFVWRQRAFAGEGLEIAQNIEKYLGLFEEGRYLPNQVVLPEHFAKPPKKLPTISDWIQIIIILALTVLVWIALGVF